MSTRRYIAVALGGGGAKGGAHIGVLKVLERQGYTIEAVAGTSVGAIVGAAYACGMGCGELENLFSGIEQARLFGRKRGDGPALLGMAGLSKILREMIGERTFQELEIPFAVTTVDIKTGQEVALKEGSVIEAVMAAIAVPGIFPPKEWNGRTLVDGGVADPVPVLLARRLGKGLPVIAVTLSAPPVEPIEGRGWRQFTIPPVIEPISRLRIAQAVDIFARSLELGMGLLSDYRLQIDKPEVIIRPKVWHIGLLERVNPAELAQFGEEAALEMLEEVRKATSWRGRLYQKLFTKKTGAIEYYEP